MEGKLEQREEGVEESSENDTLVICTYKKTETKRNDVCLPTTTFSLHLRERNLNNIYHTLSIKFFSQLLYNPYKYAQVCVCSVDESNYSFCTSSFM